VDISGSGTFNFAGKADALTLKIDGLGKFYAFDLQTRETTVRLSGSGRVEISCSESLTVNGSGLGKVEYKGSPGVNTNTSGSVSVTPAK
ncbi:MAG: DUF2807 domain-containing protein, partial [Clostridiales bacterium]|nr:DUF2807 domain-containing protein [Clostridiales bacterium]